MNRKWLPLTESDVAIEDAVKIPSKAMKNHILFHIKVQSFKPSVINTALCKTQNNSIKSQHFGSRHLISNRGQHSISNLLKRNLLHCIESIVLHCLLYCIVLLLELSKTRRLLPLFGWTNVKRGFGTSKRFTLCRRTTYGVSKGVCKQRGIQSSIYCSST